MARIRVDQSHCNYYLAAQLSKMGWLVLFTDAGRVSRGGIGYQGAVLALFEEAGLPIPDIVATANGRLLVIEVDASLSKAMPSLRTYNTKKAYLLEAGSRAGIPGTLRFCTLGFCRTGLSANPGRFFRVACNAAPSIDLFVAFQEPRLPVFHWA